jgi:hypothetical protein
MTSAIVKPETLFPSKDSAQSDHFPLRKEELASYPVLFLVFYLSFSASLYHNSLVFLWYVENFRCFVAVHFVVPYSLNSCLH